MCLSRKLYKDHIPTATWEKAFLAVACSVKAIHDPSRADMVAAVGETILPTRSLNRLKLNLLSSPTGRQILKEKPIISDTTLSDLKGLSKSTFGGAYYHDFMKKYQYQPSSRTNVQFIDDQELAYILLRYRQVHDFWHVLTGLTETTLESELCLKLWEFVHLNQVPMTGLASLSTPFLLNKKQSVFYLNRLLPWLIKDYYFSNTKNMLSVYYEHWFDRDLDEFRSFLKVLPFDGYDAQAIEN